MKPVVTLIAPGNMGGAMGKRLVENGLEVRTSIAGRSEATIERARSAGMKAAEGHDLVDVDIVLSVVPPSQAVLLAEEMSELIKAMDKPPVYVDGNAVNPKTAEQICAVIEGVGGQYVDGGIIGGPPQGDYSPALYVSGAQAEKAAVLNEYGLRVPMLEGPIGAASALKMSYAGITKGLIGVGSAMILAAERAGIGKDLRKELAASQSALFTRFGGAMPGMFTKARRWGPEMEQISGYASEDKAAEQMYKGFEAFFERIGDDVEGEGTEAAILRQFFEAPDG